MDIRPLTPDRWPDLVDLFGPDRGAMAGCWCMWPRVRGVDFKAMEKTARRDAFARIVMDGPPPGLLGYEGSLAVGWVAVGPRPSVLRFNIAKTSRPAEENTGERPDIYAITCFYVRSGRRGQGVTRELAAAAIAFARSSGATAVEACAIEPDRRLQWGEGFVGMASVFRDLGFREIARRSPRRPLMRFDLTENA